MNTFSIKLLALPALLCGVAYAQAYTETVLFAAASDTSLGSQIIQAADGNFYGTALYAPSNYPFLYSLSPGGTFTMLSYVPSANSLLLQGIDGEIYGLFPPTSYCSSWCILKVIDPSSEEGFTSIYTFPGSYASVQQMTGMIEDRTGSYYIDSGARFSSQQVLKVTPSQNSLTVLNNLSYSPSQNAPLVQATNGEFYGADQYYGIGGDYSPYPSIYALDGTDSATVFQSSEALPYDFLSPLSEGPDGYLYGVGSVIDTTSGIDNGFYLYRLAVNGSSGGPIATLRSYPISQMVFASDGNGYLFLRDALVSYSPATGRVTQHWSESMEDESVDETPLLQGADGAFYTVRANQVLRLGLPRQDAPVLAAPVMVSVIPSTVAPGGKATLFWKATTAYSETDAVCVATGDWTGLVATSGQKNIDTSNAGDYDYGLTCGGNKSNSAHLTVTSKQAATTTSISASPVKGAVGDTFQLTAKVAPQAGTGSTPSGTVTLSTNGQTFDAEPLSGGTAVFNLASGAFPPGTDNIVAAYNGSYLYAKSASTPASIALTATPVASIAISPSPAGGGQPVTIVVTLATVNGGAAPTGSVTLNGASYTLTNGAVTYQTTAPAGQNFGSVQVVYAGDARYSAISNYFTYSVVPTPGISLTLDPARAAQGAAITATVTLVSPTGATGSVTFFAGSTSIGSAPVENYSTATLTASTSGVPAGSYQITGLYSGDFQNASVRSTPATVTISAK